MALPKFIYKDGRMLPAAEATVPVLAPAAKYGASVFEGICGYWNPDTEEMNIFRLREHLDRLQQSIKVMRIDCAISKDDYEKVLTETVLANGYRQDVHIRISVGVEGDGAMDASGPSSMFCAVIARPERSLQSRASHAAISSWRRIDDQCLPPRVKAAANYNNGRLAQMLAKASGFSEALLLGPTGKVSEGTGACLMMVRNGVLATPPVTAGILESVTRDTILKLGAEMGYPVAEREIDRTELYVAEEVFLCGSGYEMTPILSVDRLPVGTGAVGPETVKLWQRYEAVVRGTDSDHPAWRHAIPMTETIAV